MYRTESSKLNNIIGNIFEGGDVNIWVAARQSKGIVNKESSSCDHSRAYATNNRNKYYYLDFAEKNRILGNNFLDTIKAIIVEDDYTEIFGNSFSSKVQHPIIVGTSIPNDITYINDVDPKKSVIKHSIAFNTFFKKDEPIRSMVKYTPGTERRVECSNIGKNTDGTRYFFSESTNRMCTQEYKNIIVKNKKFIIENDKSEKFLEKNYK